MKKILIFTSSRADYGLFHRLIKKLRKKFQIKLVISGSHLSRKHGETIKEINDDEIKIFKKIRWSKFEDSHLNIVNNFSETLKKFSIIIKNYKFDLIILLGDRFETLSVAIAAHLFRIPIAHIHGGELTSGSIDDAMRHSITKLSSLHFVSHKEYKKRVIQLGENPKNVFVVGSLGAENIDQTKFLSKNNLEKFLKLKFLDKNILINFHPETSQLKSEKKQIKEILISLSKFKEINKIFTMPGIDKGNKFISSEISKFVKKNKNSYSFKSLGYKKYFSLMNNVDLMLGNSSSGILEMPSFKKITINLGIRQNGRLQANSIINLNISSKEIIKTIRNFYQGKYNLKLKKSKNIYYSKNTSDKIIEILNRINFKDLSHKKFYDLNKNKN
tara:strand:+ start:223 stop:1383 length:1161 start_codon:yes stop_codon:yes gene_type:complete